VEELLEEHEMDPRGGSPTWARSGVCPRPQTRRQTGGSQGRLGRSFRRHIVKSSLGNTRRHLTRGLRIALRRIVPPEEVEEHLVEHLEAEQEAGRA